ncbi:MAG: hypothetical protein ACYC38_10595 [Eubacteriales bacterium]
MSLELTSTTTGTLGKISAQLKLSKAFVRTKRTKRKAGRFQVEHFPLSRNGMSGVECIMPMAAPGKTLV